MRFKKLFLHSLAAVGCLMQASCDVGGPPVDLKYPSVAEADAADVRWGLPPRKAKGGSKRTYQYQVNDSGGGTSAATPVPVAAAAAEAPANSATSAPIPAKPDPQIDVNKLR